MNVVRQFFRNTVTGWIEMAVLSLIALLATPIIINNIGKEGYGVWVLVGQVVTYLFILDLGVSRSIGRFVAKYHATGDNLKLSRIISSSIFIFLVSAILITVLTFIICPNLPRLFHVGTEYFAIGKQILLIGGLSVALSFPLKIGQGVLEGLHRFDLIYLFKAIAATVKLLAIVFFFGWLKSNNLLLLALIFAVGDIIPDLFTCRLAFVNLLHTVKIGFKYILVSDLKEIYSLGLSSLLIGMATLFLYPGAIITVGRIIGPGGAAVYSIPTMLLTSASMVVAYMITPVMPMASRMIALDGAQNLKRLNINGVKVIFIVSLFITVISIMFGDHFFRIWLSSKSFSNQDFIHLKYVLIIMTVCFAFGISQDVTHKMFFGIGRQWFVAAISLITSVIGILIGIFLMLKTDLNLYGMALGWAVAYIVKAVVYLIAACRFFKIRVSLYLWQIYLPPLASAVILMAVIFLIKQIFSIKSFISLTFFISISLITYVVVVYFICLNKNEKKQIWQIKDKFVNR